MLEVSIIQHSQSYFSSPVVLVTKKYASWCMCPYYRQVNKITIKDKFHVPIFDELLDELQGEKLFTKLDLHSRYHQIRMRQEEIPTTTFRTHEGNYDICLCHLVLLMHLQHFKA
jgi:hypothetical protein